MEMRKDSKRQAIYILILILSASGALSFWRAHRVIERGELPSAPTESQQENNRSRKFSAFGYLLNSSENGLWGERVLGDTHKIIKDDTSGSSVQAYSGPLDQLVKTFADLRRTTAVTPSDPLTPTATPTSGSQPVSNQAFSQRVVMEEMRVLEDVLVDEDYSGLYRMLSADFRTTYDNEAEFTDSLQFQGGVLRMDTLDYPQISGDNGEWASVTVRIVTRASENGIYRVIWHKEDAVWKIFGTVSAPN